MPRKPPNKPTCGNHGCFMSNDHAVNCWGRFDGSERVMREDTDKESIFFPHGLAMVLDKCM